MKVNGDVTTKDTPELVDTKDTTTSDAPFIEPKDGADIVGKTPESNQQTDKWRAQLPDKYKTDPRLDGMTSIGDAMDKLFGQIDGKKEEPGSPDVKKDGDVPTEYEFSKQFDATFDPKGLYQKGIEEALKANNATPEMAEAIHAAIADGITSTMESYRKTGAEDCEAVLKSEWGDKFEKNRAFAEKAYKELVPEGSELDKNLKLTQVENNPFVQELLAKIGSGISEQDVPMSNNVIYGRQKKSESFLTPKPGQETEPWRT